MPDDTTPDGQTPRLDDDAIARLTYEQALEHLEAIVDQIESGDVGLDQTVSAYETGVKLKKRCEELLSRAEQRVEAIRLDGAPSDAEPEG